MTEYLNHIQSLLVYDAEVEYYKALEDSYNKISAEILSTSGTYTKAVMAKQLTAIRDELILLNNNFNDEFVKSLSEVTYLDANAYALDYQTIAPSVGFIGVDKKMIQKAIQTKALIFSRRDKAGDLKRTAYSVENILKNPTTTAIQQARSILLAGQLSGDSIEKIVRDLKRPLVTTQINNVRTVVRTLTAEASSQARLEWGDANREFFNMWEFVATLDTRTSSVCRSFDGRRYKEPKPQYTPPIHPNCRSLLTPIPDGYKAQERPVNLMTKQDYKTLSKLKGAEREAFRKSKIFVVDGNLTYAQAEELYPPLKQSRKLSERQYKELLTF